MSISFDPGGIPLALLFLAAATLVFASLAMWLKQDTTRRRKAIIGGLFAVFILAAAISLVRVNPFLRFRALGNDAVLECTVYQGDGKIPDGYVLLVFYRPVDDNLKAEGSFHMHPTPATNSAGPGWETPMVDLSASRAELAAVLVTAEIYGLLTSIEPGDVQKASGTGWFLRNLPPGNRLPSLFVKPQLKTTTDRSGCPEGAKIKIASPQNNVEVSRMNGVQVSGTVENLTGQLIWIFDQDLDNNHYFLKSDRPVEVVDGQFAFQNTKVGDPTDPRDRKSQKIVVVLGNDTCNDVLNDLPVEADFAKLPAGCEIGDEVKVIIARP